MAPRRVTPAMTSRPSPAPELSEVCSAQLADAETCGRPGMPGAPFPICEHHAIAAYRHVAAVLGQVSMNSAARVNASALDNLRGRPLDPIHGMNGWPAVVYYARIGDHIKIGWTTRLVSRMRWYPPSARLLAVEPGGADLEARRHDQFRHLLAARTEWFTPGPDLLRHIGELARAGLPAAPQ